MKPLFLSLLVCGFFHVSAQVGPPNNVGREYGNPKMPLFVSHLAGANKERLKRVNKNSRHSVFGKILCFRKLCRIQSGHSASLKAISFKKFSRRIARNSRRGQYSNVRIDTTLNTRPMIRKTPPVVVDTVISQPTVSAPVVKADSLIILGAEVLFELNRSNLKSEHFEKLNPIVDYLISNPLRTVKISGHTDNTGSESHNLNLSKRRADVVAEYLVSNGVDIARVQTFGFGSSKPIDANTTDAGRKKNRRVELLITGN